MKNVIKPTWSYIFTRRFLELTKTTLGHILVCNLITKLHIRSIQLVNTKMYLPSYFKTLGAGPPMQASWFFRQLKDHYKGVFESDKHEEKSLNCLFQVNILDGAAETLVLLGIIILQTDLNFHCFQEVSLLFLGVIQHSINALVESVSGHFWPKIFSLIITNQP